MMKTILLYVVTKENDSLTDLIRNCFDELVLSSFLYNAEIEILIKTELIDIYKSRQA